MENPLAVHSQLVKILQVFFGQISRAWKCTRSDSVPVE
jgi:hypothetical protein